MNKLILLVAVLLVNAHTAIILLPITFLPDDNEDNTEDIIPPITTNNITSNITSNSTTGSTSNNTSNNTTGSTSNTTVNTQNTTNTTTSNSTTPIITTTNPPYPTNNTDNDTTTTPTTNATTNQNITSNTTTNSSANTNTIPTTTNTTTTNTTSAIANSTNTTSTIANSTNTTTSNNMTNTTTSGVNKTCKDHQPKVVPKVQIINKPVQTNMLLNGDFEGVIVKERSNLAPGWLLLSSFIVNGSTVSPKWNSQIAVLAPSNPLITNARINQNKNFISQEFNLQKPLRLKLQFKAGLVTQLTSSSNNIKSSNLFNILPLMLEVQVNTRKYLFLVNNNSDNFAIDFLGAAGRNVISFSNVNLMRNRKDLIALDDIRLKMI